MNQDFYVVDNFRIIKTTKDSKVTYHGKVAISLRNLSKVIINVEGIEYYPEEFIYLYGEEMKLKRTFGKILFWNFPAKEEWLPKLAELCRNFVTFHETQRGMTIAAVENAEFSKALREQNLKNFLQERDEVIKRIFNSFISSMRKA